MNEEELKNYLKNNLKIKLDYGIGLGKKLILTLENEVISELNWPIFL